MKPLFHALSSAARAAGRRDFLTWMLAVPAVAGCTVASRDDAPGPASSGPTSPTADPTVADASEADVAQSEADLGSCRATTRDAEGPYFESGSPQRTLRIAELTEPGVRLLVEGKLVGPDCRTPLRGYVIDIWQADASGSYSDGGAGSPTYKLRGKIVSDSAGRYRFETVLPGRYGDAAGIRPAHMHAKILTPQGNPLLTTQLYFAGDPYLGQADYCTRQRTCNSSDPKRALTLSDAIVSGKAGKHATFDAYLARS